MLCVSAKQTRFNRDVHLHAELIIQYFKNTEKLSSIQFLKINSNVYKSGFFIFFNNVFNEISEIISNDSSQYFFICQKYIITSFNKLTNSIIIKNFGGTVEVIALNELKNQKSYERKIFKGEIHIIASTLDFEISLY